MMHTHSQQFRHQYSRGYIALIGVLIMGGIMLIAGLSASRSGFGSAQDAIRDEASLRARLLADACAEEALLKLRGNLLYAGSELISVNVDDSCTIGIVGGSGINNRLVRSEATVLGRTAKLEVLVATVTPMIHVSTWKQVADF